MSQIRYLVDEDTPHAIRDGLLRRQPLRHHLAAGRHIPGILILRPRCALGDIISDLLLIWEIGIPAEYRDSIGHIPF